MPYRSVISCLLIILSTFLFNTGCEEHISPDKKFSGKRIIALSPSITAQIIDLGAEENIVGVTPYHPPLKKDVPLVGTYLSPSIEKIIKLKPDIIFMSEEDGEIQKSIFFEEFGLRYHRFGRNSNFETICENYYTLAEMIGKSNYAGQKIEYYRNRLKNVKRGGSKLKVAFLISVKPIITVSKLSYISGIINEAGGINVFDDLNNPYPILTLESLIIKDPDVVIIMSRGDDRYLYHHLANFRKIGFINRKNIFVAGDELIPYYTPREYVLSVEKISEILSHVNR